MVFEEGKIVGNVNLSVSSGGRFFFGFKKCQVLVGFKIGSGHCAKRAVMLCRFGVKGQNKGSVSKARVRITSHSSGPRDARPLNSSVSARKDSKPVSAGWAPKIPCLQKIVFNTEAAAKPTKVRIALLVLLMFQFCGRFILLVFKKRIQISWLPYQIVFCSCFWLYFFGFKVKIVGNCCLALPQFVQVWWVGR